MNRYDKGEEVSEGVLLVVPICSVVMIAILMYGALLVVFFPLRKNAGGFHAKTQMGCIFFSIVALFLDYYFWEQIIRIKMICVMVSAICCVSIFVLAPQGSRNKELDITEEKVYRRRVCGILSAEVVVFIISIACDWEWGILCVGKSVTMVAVLLGLQKMQSKFWTNN